MEVRLESQKEDNKKRRWEYVTEKGRKMEMKERGKMKKEERKERKEETKDRKERK